MITRHIKGQQNPQELGSEEEGKIDLLFQNKGKDMKAKEKRIYMKKQTRSQDSWI